MIFPINDSLHHLPPRIYWLGGLSIIAAFLTAAAFYVVAMLLQVFTVLLEFSSKEQINSWLLPLVDNVYWFFGVFIVAVLLQGLGLFLQTFINMAFAETFSYEMRRRFLDALFHPGATWDHDLGTTSNIMAEVIPKSASFVTSIARFLTLLVQALILGVICLASLPEEFLYSLLAFSLIAPIIVFLNRRSRLIGSRILSQSERLNLQLMRSVKNFLYLKVLGLEQQEKEHTVKAAHAYYEQFMKSSFYYSMANSLPITYVTIVVVFLFYNFSAQGAEAPMLLTLFYLLYRFAGTVSQTVAITTGMSMYKPNFDSLLRILKETSNDDIDGDGFVQHEEQKKVPSRYALKTESLSYNYNDRQETHHSVFHNLNIELPERQMLVIKGPSGSGKTTLLMVLIGVLSHSSGRVEWGGVNMAELDTSAFRSNIGYMGPEPYIISGTVRDNLLYGSREKLTDEKLWQACREANAEQFLNAMKNGLDSRLNEQGEGLSMGQKQRLGLARALLGKPRLLVLDEVTANLDSEAEKVIISNIYAMKTGMTILVSTHSNAFDEIANQILDLGNSSILKTAS